MFTAKGNGGFTVEGAIEVADGNVTVARFSLADLIARQQADETDPPRRVARIEVTWMDLD